MLVKSLRVIVTLRISFFRWVNYRLNKLGDCACALCSVLHLPKVAHYEESVKKQYSVGEQINSTFNLSRMGEKGAKINEKQAS